MSVARFAGFPPRLSYVPIPTAFFGTLLREIDSLGELKVTLHVLRLLHEPSEGRSPANSRDSAALDRPGSGASPRPSGGPRFVRRSDLLADRALLLSLRTDLAGADRAAVASLSLAVERGTLLEVPVVAGEGRDICYLLNTGANRQTVRDINAGERTLGPFETAPVPPEVDGPASDRLSIYELYEQNVGLMTPLLAEELHEAEDSYPVAWIVDAFREAVGNNKRSWRYVKRILDNWAARGRGTSGETRRRPEPPEDSRRYLTGKYGQLVRR